MKRRPLVLVDAHISPAICAWLASTFEIDAKSFQESDMLEMHDEQAFMLARSMHAIVLTKDADYPRLLRAWGTPPQVIWLTCGNTTNARLRTVLAQHFGRALELLRSGEPLVEISDSAR